ncbi:MAG: flagellar biosynthetic protein FliO [Pseudomonadota bacterium]
MLQDLLGAQLDLPVRVAIATIVIAALLGLTVLIVRRLSGAASGGGPRSRQARLAVVDSVAVDPRRRLVLVRRDEVEHLLLVGGTTDIVVEPAIGRSTGREAGTAHRDIAPPRDTTSLREGGAPRELPAFREPAPRDSLPRRPSAAALSAPPADPQIDTPAAPAPAEVPDLAPVAHPSEPMRFAAEADSARPAVSSRPAAPPSADARRPLPPRRPLRNEDPAAPRPARPLPGLGERFARPVGAAGLVRTPSPAQEPPASAAPPVSEPELVTAPMAPSVIAPVADPVPAGPAQDSEAPPSVKDVSPVETAFSAVEAEDAKPAALAIPVFDIPAPETGTAYEPEKIGGEEAQAIATSNEEPAQSEAHRYTEPREGMVVGSSLSDDTRSREERPVAEEPFAARTEPVAEAHTADKPDADGQPEPAAAKTGSEVPAPISAAPPVDPMPVAEPASLAEPAPMEEPAPVLAPAAPLLPEMPLSPLPEPEAPAPVAASEEPAPRGEPLAAPAFRRVPMFSIGRANPTAPPERTEPQIGDLAKRLENSLGEALETPPAAPAPAETPAAALPPRGAPRVGPARFSPILRAGITPPAAPPVRPLPRDVRPTPARPAPPPPVLQGADLGLEADLVRQLELTLAREAEAEEAARAAAKAAEEKAAQSLPTPDSDLQSAAGAEKSSDPFDDLEAEMATLLGRTPGAR